MKAIFFPVVGSVISSSSGRVEYTVDEVRLGHHVTLSSRTRRVPSKLHWGDIAKVFNSSRANAALSPTLVDRILDDPQFRDSSPMCAIVLFMLKRADQFSGDEESQEFRLPEELPADTVFVEGAVRKILVNAYERDPMARQACISVHGTDCCVCGFSFGREFGPVAAGFIHVHHLHALAQQGGEHIIDPVADLRPVCPNCHAVLHRREPIFSIEELRELRRKNSKGVQ